jgi:HNH endonuclease/NUMOD4 motif
LSAGRSAAPTPEQDTVLKGAIEWRTIPGFGEYEVSNRGDVRRSVPRANWPAGHLLKPARSKSGHLYVMLAARPGANRSKKQFVHRLVARAFLGKPPLANACVLHGDDDPSNNSVANLRWGTRKDNHADRMRNRGWKKRIVRGSDAKNAKLAERDVLIIRKMFALGARNGWIAKFYDVSPSAICDVVKYRSWAHVEIDR